MSEGIFDFQHQSAFFHALSGLRVYDRTFSDKRPYTVIAALIGGHVPDAEDVAFVTGLRDEIQVSVDALRLTRGDLLGAKYALDAVVDCTMPEVNAQLIYNIVTKAETAAKG
jgi:hypothetical protein